MAFRIFNRRSFSRRRAAVPVQIDAKRGARIGMTRDLGQSGVLFFSNSLFAVGERVRLTFCVSDLWNANLQVQGKVIRVEIRDDKVQWRYAHALRFDPPLPGELLIPIEASSS